MRTVIIILIGFIIWAIVLTIAWFGFQFTDSATSIATKLFIFIWFIISAWNMWMGISKAGYTFMQELPIFLIIFLLPVIVAIVVQMKFI